MKPIIILRADGNSTIGLGHVIRSLALAEMLVSEFECHFLIQDPMPYLEMEISKVCAKLIKLPTSTDFINEAHEIADKHLTKEDVVVLDGYNFTTDYQSILRKRCTGLACIDDIHAYHFIADLVINHTGGLTADLYSVEPYTRLLLGLKYALLRKPFRSATYQHTVDEREENTLLIGMGGADPGNHTLETVKFIQHSNNSFKLNILLGAGYRFKSVLQDYLKSSELKYEIFESLNATDLVSLMAKTRMAILPPSTIAYEYLSIGGVLYLNVIADNQLDAYEYLMGEGLAFPLESFPLKDPVAVDYSLSKQKSLLDGKQANRLRKEFRRLFIKLRRAEPADCEMYFIWANDPEVRKNSYNPDPIPRIEHDIWFSRKLSNKDTIMYLGEFYGSPFGQVRFEYAADLSAWVVNFSLDKDFRGIGMGTALLDRAITRLRYDNATVDKIIGYVKKDNPASEHAFLNLGFSKNSTDRYPDSFCFIIDFHENDHDQRT